MYAECSKECMADSAPYRHEGHEEFFRISNDSVTVLFGLRIILSGYFASLQWPRADLAINFSPLSPLHLLFLPASI
jgi:hypothetical protein